MAARGPGNFDGQTAIDAHAKAVRLGWMPGLPTFARNPLALAAGVDPVAHVVDELESGRLRFAIDDPSAPANWASFAVGVVFVNGWYTPARRGFALGVYGMGMGGTVIAALSAPRISDEWGLRAPFLVAAGVLLVTSAVFATMARDAAAPAPRTGPLRLLAPLQVFRTSSRAWALTLFYFLSFGGFVAMFLYLPKLLTGEFDLSKTDAGSRAAGFALFALLAVLAVLARPVGGMLADRVDPRRVLRVSFIATSILAVVLAFSCEHMVPLTIACLTLAVFLGLGTGAVFKLVAHWFPQQVGAVTGVVGAAGGLGGFFPPLVMGVVKSATGSYTIGFLLLAAVAAGALVVATRVSDPPA